MFFQLILLQKFLFTSHLRTDVLVVCWIGIICIVSSSSTAAPLNGGGTLATLPTTYEMATRAPAALVTPNFHSTPRLTTIKAPAELGGILDSKLPGWMANPKLTNVQYLSRMNSKSPSVKMTGELRAPGSQSKKVQIKKESLGIKTERNIAAKIPTFSQSQKTVTKISKPLNPEPPDKPQRFRLKNFGKDYLKSIISSPTTWKKFMRMKQNVLTLFHFFKALMKKVKQFKPRSYASDESVKEIQRNVRKAPEVKKPSLTDESLSDVAEAKVTRERSTKPHPSESSDLHPSSWRRVRNIFANQPNGIGGAIQPRLSRSSTMLPEPFETNRLLGSKSLPPPSVITSHPDKSLIAAIGSPTASTSETELISIDQKPGLSRQKTSQFPSDVKEKNMVLSRQKTSHLPSDVKAEVVRHALQKLAVKVVQPAVMDFLTPQVTSQIVASLLLKHPVMSKVVATLISENYTHQVIRNQLAPTIVKALSAWATMKVEKHSENIFDLMEHHAIDFLEALEKVEQPPSPAPPS
ncbi:hypothetical protein PCASD_00581 [Puccinia coronata f. sp. avenae]|uniref:Uncharacterized protein n=1 Tax=Puccinia coronata f. sp. avenae TaxID=200324 RepID=A0A2N5VNY7_9BASI|nr:hypothetical protein PCASD_00581 [Puccinia coronata f. sp. avenae]